MKKAMYVGSFDPVTSGHINILVRASRLFDEVVVVVSANTAKKYWFSVDQRVDMIRTALEDNGVRQVSVMAHDGLTVSLAEELDISILIRGIRSIKDMEYEVDIATLNKIQNNNIETVFLISDEQYRSISSTMVKEIAYYNGKIDSLVPSNVAGALIDAVIKRRSS
ncbi:pantetheine-phosphate adenylyltransferase [Alkalibacterium thalassium]|uniref:Phosphopantetheine adenylyltransferase n=1 Tax=Alkalibacterium thalassium TaxID=426701 RepID=A0A1G8WWU3_9LACT|nr:pantetheine-phosphate adenylyltransferase [Alkalibacterium thalassium]SDJ82020.1 Phosphopantetheine adenylyltransferase [Alkalibacterium thalassium]